tara:strand:+ start:89 stop:232 length:144 start_codon:yes stop_codon:yes gene_type:complete
MEHDCDVENLKIQTKSKAKSMSAEAASHQQKEAQKGNPWNTIVTLRS